MSIVVTDHGTWSSYEYIAPSVKDIPLLMGVKIIGQRRDSDQTDWYAFYKQLSASSLKLLAANRAGKWIIVNQNTDASALVPAGLRLIEIEGADKGTQFIGSSYDPDTKTIDSLVGAKANKITELRNACGREIRAGFTSAALGSLHSYPTDDTSQKNLAAAVAESTLPGLDASWKTPVWCSDQNGTWLFADHTQAQIQQVGRDSRNVVVTAQAKLAGLTVQVNGASTIDAVTAITW